MFRRFSKRRIRASLLVALLDRLEWGPPIITGYDVTARQDGICAACGYYIVAQRERIVPAEYGPPGMRIQTHIHAQCPSYWAILADTVEQYDDKIITKINPQGRGKASGCGHDVEGQSVYLVRRPISLKQWNHSSWLCKECAKPQ